MCPHVRLEIDGCSECLGADAAHVVALPGVDLAVDGERVFPRELLAAELASELLQVGVERLHVVAEVTGLPKALPAMLTFVRTLICKELVNLPHDTDGH